MVAAGALLLPGVVLFLLGRVEILGRAAPYFLLAMTAVFAVFAHGLHGLLWAGGLRESRVPVSLRSLVSAVLALIACLVIAVGVGLYSRWTVMKYVDAEYGFAFSYPSSWTVEVSDGPGARQVFVVPSQGRSGATAAHCAVNVERTTRDGEYTQTQLNASMTAQPMTSDAWSQLLGGGSWVRAPVVVDAHPATLFGNPVHYALTKKSTSRGGLPWALSEHHYITHTPHLTWELTCSNERPSIGPGGSQAVLRRDAEAVRRFAASLRLAQGVVH